MSSGVYLKRFGETESKMDLTASQSELGSYQKQKTCTTVVKVLSFFLFVALAAAVAASIALAFYIRGNDLRPITGDNSAQVVDVDKTTQKPGTTTTAVPEDPTVCMTPECVVAAARIYESLDTSVHPCDNFFEYACGGWIQKHPIPEDRSRYNAFSVLGEELSVILKVLLEQDPKPDDLSAVVKAKNLYKSCIDEELIEDRGLEPLQAIFEEYGEWPLLNTTWSESSFNLLDMLLRIKKYGSSPLIYQGVSTDLKNSSYRILELDQPGLIMPGRDYYLSKANDSIPALRKYIISLAEAFGAEDMTQVEQDVDEMIEFETKIANLTVPAEKRRDPDALYNKFMIKDLSASISDKIDWFRFHYEIMIRDGVDINITEDEPVIVYSPDYLRDALDLIHSTPPRILMNYLMTTEILSFISYLPKNLREIRTAYNKVLYGTQTAPARWKSCVGATSRAMGNAVGRLFVDKAFDEDAKSIALDMINDIREAFDELLEGLDWMDVETQEVAKEKAAAMQEKIGYSETEIKNDTNLNEKYQNATYEPDKYFENALMRFRYNSIESFRKLREPIDKTKWLTHPAVVNAFYSSTRNGITFPAGILQPPFFSKHYPKSMNYGGIGLVIGHEITHGFDDRGRTFDKNGDLVEWWNEDVVKRFKAKAKCIIEQYANYTVPEANMKLNGINTQGENIADNGGLIQAFTAYRDWVKEQGKEEPILPGLDFNNNQLFFLNVGQIWCNAMRSQSAVNSILTGVHSPGRFRVIGMLQNSKEFSEAFNCPKTSYMNPEKKCRVW